MDHWCGFHYFYFIPEFATVRTACVCWQWLSLPPKSPTCRTFNQLYRNQGGEALLPSCPPLSKPPKSFYRKGGQLGLSSQSPHSPASPSTRSSIKKAAAEALQINRPPWGHLAPSLAPCPQWKPLSGLDQPELLTRVSVDLPVKHPKLCPTGRPAPWYQAPPTQD